MSWLSDLFHPGQAYGHAEDVNQQGYNEGKGLRQPYIDQGGKAGESLQEMLDKLMHPEKLQDEWSNNYETSASAKQDQANAQANGTDAASAMGLGGSSAALNNIQNRTSDIGQKDKQQYMKDLMEKYMSAIGIGKDVYNTGAATANAGAGAAQQFGENQAGLDYGKHNSGSGLLGGILGGGAGILGSIFGGPIGGALGGAAGNWLGGKLGNPVNNQTGNKF